MARINNLTNFLTDVATAIKTKKGDSTPISASNFDTEIANLPSGGGSSEYFDTNYYVNNIGMTTSISSPYAPGRVFACWVIKKLEGVVVDMSKTLVSTSSAFMFYCWKALETVDVSQWNMSTVTFFRGMFYNCESLQELDISNWSLQTGTGGQIALFTKGCASLRYADYSSFEGYFNIGELCDGCVSLQHLDIRGLDLTQCTNYENFLGSPRYSSTVPYNCEIIVADNTQKTFMNTNFPDYTNVKTVAEYEAE